MMASNSKNNASTAVATQAQFVGIIPEYDGDTDDWSVYQEILEEYFKANGVPDGSKVSVLISVIGADTYRLLRDLCHPDSPKDKSYAELCAMLAKQFLPEIAIFRERAKFYRAKQERGEDVKTWYARLKNLSVNCKFGEHLEPLLLDKFIVGLLPGPVQDRLCEESEKLTLKEALNLAANRESAVRDDVLAEDMADMHLDDLRGGRRKHGGGHHHRGHRHHHDHDQLGDGRHGYHGRRGGHGPPHHGRHGQGHHCHEMHFGPHAWGGHHLERGFHGFKGMEPWFGGVRRRDMKRWSKLCRKMQGRQDKSSSSSSSSSSESETEDEKRCKGRRYKGHMKHGHHGKFERRHEGGPGKCSREKRCGRKEEKEAEPNATENTEPELIE